MKTYRELMSLETFKERFRYLQLKGNVGDDTFGFDRYLNQEFYKSKEWKQVRDQVIVRDNGCDLGLIDRPIYGKIYIHHIEPITIDDVRYSREKLLDPNNLICVSLRTHNAIHYGDESVLEDNVLTVRRPNDTCPWK